MSARFDLLGVVAGDDHDLADPGRGERIERVLGERSPSVGHELLGGSEPSRPTRPRARRRDHEPGSPAEQAGDEPRDRRPQGAEAEAEPTDGLRRRRGHRFGLGLRHRRRLRRRLVVQLRLEAVRELLRQELGDLREEAARQLRRGPGDRDVRADVHGRALVARGLEPRLHLRVRRALASLLGALRGELRAMRRVVPLLHHDGAGERHLDRDRTSRGPCPSRSGRRRPRSAPRRACTARSPRRPAGPPTAGRRACAR